MSQELNFSVNPQNELQNHQVVDLQIVACFANLVELLANELGANSSDVKGALPTARNTFDELIGTIDITRHGLEKKLVVTSRVNEPLKLDLFCTVKDKNSLNSKVDSKISPIPNSFDVSLTMQINKFTKNILPQGRALARNIEDMYSILECMVAIGQDSRIISMSPTQEQIEAFELSNSDSLIQKR